MNYDGQIPTLLTSRLLLRPFNVSDGPEVQRQAGNIKIAQTTLNVPHPYKEGMAEVWIETHQEAFESKEAMTLAITESDSGQLVGCISLDLMLAHKKAELGYWIGEEFWGRGYGTEAAKAIVKFGFESLGINKIQARYMAGNEASGKIMRKIGMEQEGYLKEDVVRLGKLTDTVVYGLLKVNFKA